MNTRLALAALLLWTGSASADLAGAMAKCKSIADASARTICYDAISAAAPETPPVPPAAAPAAPAVAAPPPPPAAPAAPEEIHGKVAGEIGGWKLNDIIKLQDGSRWKVVADVRTGFKTRNNPDVTIKKSFFNWWLSIDGSSFRTKVMLLE